MRHSPYALAVTLAFGACALANANAGTASPDDGAGRRAEHRAALRQQAFDALDANHDGVVSRDEYRAWIDRRFAGLDGNGDGRVDADEIAGSAAAKRRAQRRAERLVERFDSSGSGTLERADFEAKAMQRFDRIADGGDTITAAQFAAAGRHGRRHHRDGGDPTR